MDSSTQFVLQKVSEENFQVLKYLGNGSYGQVVMARDRATGDIVAMKMMKKKRTPWTSFLEEVCTSISLSSYPGIISTHSCIIDSADYSVMIQDFAPAGTLHSIIQPHVGIPEVLVRRCALQLCRALEFMHSKQLVHRDLKPDNVLLMDPDCHHIKLSDFGLTQEVGTLAPFMSPIIPYMSPELCRLRRNEYITLDPSVDVWALGVLLFVAFHGHFPWRGAVEDDQQFKKFSVWQNYGDHVPPPKPWTKFNKSTQDLFHVLLSLDPEARSLLSVLSNIDVPWGAEDDPIVMANDDEEIREHEREIIIIEGRDEYIVVENHGDIDHIIVNEAIDASSSGSSVATMILVMDDADLGLGCEVEVT